MSDTLTLANGDARLNLRPAYGGRISGLAFADWEVLRPIPETEKDVWRGYKGGSFPLVPFSNRIKDARLTFQGRDIALTPHRNEPTSALHGHGCFSEWIVDGQTGHTADLSYTHTGGHLGWPWTYRARQHFELTPDSCRITLGITNQSDAEMPAGLGFHPFFPFDGDVTMRFGAEAEWISPPEAYPTEQQPLAHEFGGPDGQHLWRDTKTVCFEGYQGQVDMIWRASGHRLRMTSDGLLDHFIVHVPDGAVYFCPEPVSHPTDGFNLAAQGVAGGRVLTLQPGQTVTASMAYQRL
ncbi:MAG: aldose 1-epimerase [Rhodospirillales bacterium]|nr:aldose 1-epimerase [Rhodospirillales bacterium]